MQNPRVGIVMGSASDYEIMKGAADILDEFNIPYEVTVTSAHRTPANTHAYAKNAADRGIAVIIAGAGWAAHLAGVIASETFLPVIGVPIASSPLQGLDALFSTVQMPGGIPVATMSIGIGGAKNAGIFAVQILSLNSPEIRKALADYRKKMVRSVEEKNSRLQQKLS